MRTRLVDLEDARLGASAHDLALVGEVSLLLGQGGGLDIIETALRCIAERTGADAAELFLAAPDGSEVFMVSHLGADTNAFCQQDRFDAGEGFPGIALSTACALWTPSLTSEADFIRSRVKALGYRCAVSVPLHHGGVVGGCIVLVWKEARGDLEHLVRAATLAAQPLANAVVLARAQLQLRPASELADRLRATASADSATVLLRSPGTAGGLATPSLEGCPSCQGVEVQVLGGRAGWPRQCLEAGCTAKARYCVPLVSGDTVWGVASVAFNERAPVPLTRHLAEALWLTERASPTSSPFSGGPANPEPGPRGKHLRVECLGGFRVLVGDVPLEASDFGRAKSRELLALLIAAGGRPLAGRHLCEALWPDAEPTLARNRLHVTLSTLRSVVDPKDPNAPAHIRRDGVHYFIDPQSSVHSDLWCFRDRFRDAGAALSEGRNDAEAMACLEAVIGLYAGDPFGGEFPDGWGQAVMARERGAMLWAIEQLVALQRASGDLAAAVATLRRAQELDLLREDLSRQLMEVLVALGRPAESAECYRHLTETLAATLGTTPAAATRRLHEALHSPS